jgi:hypothetical protein
MTAPTDAAPSPAPRAGAPHKRQLKNYLINKRYQLQYTLVMVVVSAIIMSVLGYLVYRKQKTATENLITFAKSTFDDPAVLEQITGDLKSEDTGTLYTLVGAGAGLAVFLTVFGIVMTHKVAGPLYKITNYFHKMKDGDFSKVYNLRKGDQLVEFYGEFKDMHDALRARQAAEAERLGQLLSALEKAGLSSQADVADAYAQLKQLKEQKEKSLG